jgi:hypothetical protein
MYASVDILTVIGFQIEDLAGATGLEPAASCVTGRRSNQLNYAPALDVYILIIVLPIPLLCFRYPSIPSRVVRFPSLPSGRAVTGQRSNQLNYVPTRQFNNMRNNQCLCGFAQIAYRAPSALTDPDCS